MLKQMMSCAVISSVMALGGCQSSNKSSVADVPPPASGPITAAHDPSLAGPGPVALKTSGGAGSTYQPAPDFTLSAPAPLTPAAPVGAGGNYVVRQGDTLWSISRSHYGTGQRWKDIAAANPGISAERLPVGRPIVLP